MRRIFTLLVALLTFVTVQAQVGSHSIIIDEQSFAPESGLAIDKIGKDTSQRPCARIKMRINRMTSTEIDQLKVVTVGGNVVVMKQYVATEGNGLIIELTAKQPTRFYLHHDKYGDSNEVSLNLEGDKEYRLSAQLNISYPIVIATNVIDAEVYIDGMYQGRSDSGYTLTVNDITPGTHKLRVQSGSSIAEQNIEVSSTAIYFRLDVNVASSRPQYVVFSVTPKNAIVVVDNKNCVPDADGIVQLTLNNGSYNYHISANSYHDERGTFVVSGSKVEKNIELLPAHGWVEVGSSSHLNGASVYIDGNYIGQAPIKSDKLASGKHSIKIVKNLYHPYEDTITIEDNETLKYTPSLSANFATVTLSTANGAGIYVNDKYKGTTTWTGDLETGLYIFEARKEGHRTTTISKEISAKPQKQNITLESPTPITGYLNLTTSPTMASVKIDGKEIGESPLMEELLIGSHTVSASKKGYKVAKTTVTIKEGETTTLPITLQEDIEPAKLLISSDPGGAAVYIDKKYTGYTPNTGAKSISVEAGTHKFKIKKSGYKKYNETITLSGGQDIKINAILEPKVYTKLSNINNDNFKIGVSAGLHYVSSKYIEDTDWNYEYHNITSIAYSCNIDCYICLAGYDLFDGLVLATGLEYLFIPNIPETYSYIRKNYLIIPAMITVNFSLGYSNFCMYYGLGTAFSLPSTLLTAKLYDVMPLMVCMGFKFGQHSDLQLNLIGSGEDANPETGILGIKYGYFF